MPTYNSVINRSEVALPEDKLTELFEAATESSVVMQLATRLRNMRRDELKLRVNSELPVVYYVDEVGKTSTFPNTTLKQTTSAAWSDVTLYARELAAIIPVPNNVINDEDFDIFGNLKGKLAAAIAKEIDRAVMFGNSETNTPDDWPEGIFIQLPADHKITINTGSTDLYDNLLGDLGAFAQVELDGYEVNGIVAATRMRGLLRGLRADTGTGMPIFMPSMVAGEPDRVAGVPVYFPKNGGFVPTDALALVGDWKQLVYSIAQDVEFTVHTDGIIQDGNGAIVYNLMQQDMTALRVTFRFAWELPKPATYTTVSGVQFPFSAVIPE